MDRTELQQQIDLFDPALPVEAAWTLPASWYVEPEFLRLEAEAVFDRHWCCAVRTDQVRGTGDYAAASALGRHRVVVRDRDGALRAFHNVCRHHGTVIMAGEGQCAEMVCPYHGWTYGLDGRLKRAPHAGGNARL